MPTVGVFSQQYWNGNRHTNVVTPPPLASGGGLYPMWEASVITPVVVFGPPLDLIKRYWARLVWTYRVFCLLWAVPDGQRESLLVWVRTLPTYPKPERAVLEGFRCLLASDTWPLAQRAVQATATTLGFNEAKFWKSISTQVHRDPGHAQQMFRHLHAVQQVKALRPDLSSHVVNLAVEAAYHAFTKTPKTVM